MQEAFHCIHTHNNTQSDVKEQEHTNNNCDGISTLDTTTDCFLEKDL